jgi:hypothetical protein
VTLASWFSPTDQTLAKTNKENMRYNANKAQNNGFRQTSMKYCTPTVKQQGYMQDASDWRDVEPRTYGNTSENYALTLYRCVTGSIIIKNSHQVSAAFRVWG